MRTFSGVPEVTPSGSTEQLAFVRARAQVCKIQVCTMKMEGQVSMTYVKSSVALREQPLRRWWRLPQVLHL
jgi:hypothetical protein